MADPPDDVWLACVLAAIGVLRDEADLAVFWRSSAGVGRR